jgi:hypothetical protein
MELNPFILLLLYYLNFLFLLAFFANKILRSAFLLQIPLTKVSNYFTKWHYLIINLVTFTIDFLDTFL